MNKALFLDRDGVINRERGEYTYKLEDFEILPDLASSLRIASEKGYKLIVISNQGGIAKGIYSKLQVEELHGFLNQELKLSGIKLDEIYYSPHHDSVGKSLCRKPGSLMLEKAIARFELDARLSVFIGDSETDIMAANRVGVRGVLIKSNSSILELVKELE